MAVYSPTEKASSCKYILDATHALFAASLLLCDTPSREMEGVVWTCFIIENTPMVRTHFTSGTMTDAQKLRLDFRKRYPQTCHANAIFGILQANFGKCTTFAQRALCGALPILTTWDTQAFVDDNRVGIIVGFMMSRPRECRNDAMRGLGQLASVVLDRLVRRGY